MTTSESSPTRAALPEADEHQDRGVSAGETRTVLNALTVDVEDYFQVSAFEALVDRSAWPSYECRVEQNTHLLLDLMRRHGVRATYFVLGWVAEHYPALIRRIHEEGHEVQSHGYEHRLVYDMTPDAFREDLRRAAAAIRSACGVNVDGFRAPSFSIHRASAWAYDVLRDEGYRYSSSIFPVRHDRYGVPDFPRRPVRLVDDTGKGIWEFPMTTWRVLGRNLPAAGGGWMRLYPLALTRRAILRMNAMGAPGMVYVHPWEFDPDQPRIDGAARRTQIRHHLAIRRMPGRLEALIRHFDFGTVADVLEHEAARPGGGATLAFR